MKSLTSRDERTWVGILAGLVCVASFYFSTPAISPFAAIFTVIVCGSLAFWVGRSRSREVYLVNDHYFVGYLSDGRLVVIPRSEVTSVVYDSEGDLIISSGPERVKIGAEISNRESIRLALSSAGAD